MPQLASTVLAGPEPLVISGYFANKTVIVDRPIILTNGAHIDRCRFIWPRGSKYQLQANDVSAIISSCFFDRQ